MTTGSSTLPATRLVSAAVPGAPTVVLLSGAGDCAASWLPVQQALAPEATVLAYDRAGLGDSASAEVPACTLDRYLTELDDVVAAAVGEPRTPVVLVGHSLGGLLAAAYAARRPAAVGGLVLVDATPPQAGCDRAVSAGFAISGALARGLRTGSRLGATPLLLRLCLMPGYSGQRRLRTRLSSAEYQDWHTAVARSFRHGAAAELRAVPGVARDAAQLFDVTAPGCAFDDLPLAVVSSSAYGPKWEAWQEQWAAQSGRSVHIRTGDRSHDIHLCHPDLVIDAVREVLAHGRRRAAAM